ncbi:MAG TPA: AAA family ATPase [Anaerolineales bacterium]|jgi:DNA-binding SARP family transcriptional activator|nr:AAA family ATPase [Anaerolineales bacterium]
MQKLEMRFLGAPQVDRLGKLVEVDTRKAIALLAYLAVTGETHTRDALATLLWPDLDQSRSRAALRRTLSTLKHAVGEAYLDIEREFIRFSFRTGVWLDVTEFQNYLEETYTHGHTHDEVCPLCLPPLNAAVVLYRDDFLAGFTLRDSANFDDWQFFQSENLRRRLAAALERLAHGYAAQHEFERAIEHAQRWLALDELHEPAHRQLMQIYALAGQRNAALRQYRECVRILAEELDVSPLEETVQLYEAIRDNRIQGHIQPIIANKTVDSGHLTTIFEEPASKDRHILVGRTNEWATLLEVYDSLDSQGHLVVIEGEAGIGRTRLAEEFLAYVGAQGAVAIAAKCYEGESDLSYGPVVEALRVAVNQSAHSDWRANVAPHWLAEVARLLPEIVELSPDLPQVSSLEGPGAQTRLYEAIAQFILALCVGPLPGVFFIDDLHWADTASLDLLTYLVRRSRRHPILFLGTWRSGEVAVNHRLNQLLRDAQRAGKATLISLPRLGVSDVEDLVGSLYLESVPEGLAERLYQESEGLPFFVVEYLSALSKQEPPLDGLTWSLPGSVRDLLYSRLSEVSETGWQLLTTAAVIGRSFGFEILRAVSGRSEEETIASLEALVDQGLVRDIREQGDENELTYDFSHEKLREFVYEETSLARRRLLHRRVAENLIHRARITRDAGLQSVQIAHHYQLAGEDQSAAKYYELAGEQARNIYANSDALSHFRTALALGHPDLVALHAAIGDIQTLLGEYDSAIRSYETAAAVGDQSMLPSLERKLGVVHHRLGEWKPAESHFQSALAALEGSGDDRQRSMIYADWSLTAHSSGQAAKSQELGQKALHLAETILDQRALAQAHNLLGILARGQGDLEQAKQHLAKSLQLAEQLDDPWVRVAALNNLALVRGQDNEMDVAIRTVETALSLCASLGDRHREAALHNNLADLYHATGQAEESMLHLRKAVMIYAEIGEQAGSWQPEIWKLSEW